MVDMSDNLQTEISSETTALRMLVTIYLDDMTIKLVANTPNNIIFAGIEYTSAQIERSEIESNSDGSSETINLKLSNNNRTWAIYLAQNGNILGNRRCLVQEISESYLEDEDDVITIFDGVINNVSMTSNDFSIDVVRSLGTYEGQSPLMTYNSNCQWSKFKDVRCGYVGSETVCDRTLTRCKGLSNVLNYGGHPSIVEQMLLR